MMKTPRLKNGLLKNESSCLVLSSFGTVSVLLSEMRLESSLGADQMDDTAVAVNGRWAWALQGTAKRTPVERLGRALDLGPIQL
jgi:hypothetical protein